MIFTDCESVLLGWYLQYRNHLMDSVSVVLYFNVNEVSALLKSFGYFNCSFININVRGGGGGKEL